METSTGTETNPQAKFNTFAIVGFVLAFIANAIGLIFSIVALVQIHRTGERGQRLAIAGIAVSVAVFVLSVVFAVIGFLGHR